MDRLEDQIRIKNEKIKSLRQRELWFEAQLRHQIEGNASPLNEIKSRVDDMYSAMT